jgi:hypothetical protein
MQKASEWAQSHVFLSYDKCGSLCTVGVIAKNAVCSCVVMLLYTSCVGFRATTSADPSEG